MWTLDDAPLPLWRPVAGEAAVTMAFSTRRGGVSAPPYDSLNLGRSTPDRIEAVDENRRRLLEALGLDPMLLVTAGQVHGAEVTLVDAAGHVPGCDALLTTRRGLTLAVTTADCMSLIYTAPGAIAVAHAGWRGVAAGMPAAVLDALRASARVPVDRIAVHFGPCIRSCCYEVGDDVALRFPAAVLLPARGRWRLDLPGAARLQLLAAGMGPSAIDDVGACTACEPQYYYSHRRDHGIAGRHWAVAALRA